MSNHENSRSFAIKKWLKYGWKSGVELGAVLALIPPAVVIPFWELSHWKLPDLKVRKEKESFGERCERYRIKFLHIINPFIKLLQGIAYGIHEAVGYLFILPIWIVGTLMGIVGTVLFTIPALVQGGLRQKPPPKYQKWQDTFRHKCGAIYHYGELWVQFCIPPILWVGAAFLTTLGLIPKIGARVAATVFSMEIWHCYVVPITAGLLILAGSIFRTSYHWAKNDYADAKKCFKEDMRDIWTLIKSVLIALAITMGLKAIIQEPRPNAGTDFPFPYNFDNYAFPSGHMAMSMAAAGMMKYRYGEIVAAPFYAMSALVGVSRVVNEMHNPYDVFAGAVVGSTVAFVMAEFKNNPLPSPLREKPTEKELLIEKPLDLKPLPTNSQYQSIWTQHENMRRFPKTLTKASEAPALVISPV